MSDVMLFWTLAGIVVLTFVNIFIFVWNSRRQGEFYKISNNVMETDLVKSQEHDIERKLTKIFDDWKSIMEKYLMEEMQKKQENYKKVFEEDRERYKKTTDRFVDSNFEVLKMTMENYIKELTKKIDNPDGEFTRKAKELVNKLYKDKDFIEKVITEINKVQLK